MDGRVSLDRDRYHFFLVKKTVRTHRVYRDCAPLYRDGGERHRKTDHRDRDGVRFVVSAPAFFIDFLYHRRRERVRARESRARGAGHFVRRRHHHVRHDPRQARRDPGQSIGRVHFAYPCPRIFLPYARGAPIRHHARAATTVPNATIPSSLRAEWLSGVRSQFPARLFSTPIIWAFCTPIFPFWNSSA